MNILLIAPTAYNYYVDIMGELIKQGHAVDYLPDFVPSFINRSIRFVTKKGIAKLQNKYIRAKIGLIDRNYHCVLLIRGYGYDDVSIRLMKEKFSSARFILYQWDPLSVSLFSIKALHFFDKSYTFDYVDAETYPSMIQKSLFYSEKYNEKEKDHPLSIDISFVGSDHSGRVNFCELFVSKLKDTRINMYIKFNCQLFKALTRILRYPMVYVKAMRNGWISFSPIPRTVSQQIFDSSRAVLDIHHPKQRGLSIRVIEVLSKGKKLITTNPYVKRESFYNPNMICVIDRDNPSFDVDFLKRENEDVNVSEFRLDNWLLDILK